MAISNKSSFYDGNDFKTIKLGNFEANENMKTSFEKKQNELYRKQIVGNIKCKHQLKLNFTFATQKFNEDLHNVPFKYSIIHFLSG